MTIIDRKRPLLAVVLGATATGKTGVSIALAKEFGAEVVSCDSRQFYSEIPIGTAAPTLHEQDEVPHHFIGSRSLQDEYSAGKYAEDALLLLDELFASYPLVIMTGGSGLYIDAVCNGMDDMPAVDPAFRRGLRDRLAGEGLESLSRELRELDPEYCAAADMNNPQRILRALEICLSTGRPYTSFRKGGPRDAVRPFDIVKVGLRMPREILYDRINRRVDAMMGQGLEEEARAVYHLREVNALQTVGYREMFRYFDGEIGRDEAVALIKQNSRRYAKRQETWFGRDGSIRWFDAFDNPVGNIENITRFLKGYL